MTPRCLISDLDRTLTGADLQLDPRAIERIREIRAAGVRVVIATGRRLDEVEAMGLAAEVDGLVAENGAIVRVQSAGILEIIHPDFGNAARAALGALAAELHWGRVIGSGPRALAGPLHERLGVARLPHALEFNANEVMLLPNGVSKATGAERCLTILGLTAEDAWAIGDGDNDAALLRFAKLGAAPANASPAARQAADVLLTASYSQAFVELTAPLVARTAPRL